MTLGQKNNKAKQMEAHILGRVVTACAVIVGVGCFLLANVVFYEALMATFSQWADAQSLRVWNSSPHY